MKELRGDLWDPAYACFWRGLTTNGYVKQNGQAVMGRGVAYQATLRYPGIAKELGAWIAQKGNRVHLFPQYKVFSFPVKVSWEQPAKLDLIVASAEELAALARIMQDATFLLPRPGCGNGGLSWDVVGPLLALADLPDNVIVIERRIWP